MNSHAAISTISLFAVTFVITISLSAAAPVASASSNQNNDLLGQLMQVAASEQQQQQQQSQPTSDSAQVESSGQLKMLLGDSVSSKKQRLAAKPSSKYQASEQKKLALKRKWHKLVDDLIDNNAAADESSSPIQEQLNKRLISASGSSQQVHQYLQKPTTSNDQPNLAAGQAEDSKLSVILVKRKPDADGNGLGDLFASESQQTTVRQPINTEQHQRRILNDDFGILKDSKFSTNNQLGLKGVPKFGSDETF